ncbi:MAG: hypothetical protein CMI58_05670 [Parcubacteria group bacterium]|nr:hypothetical protein [Parcubacteria group bacterium]|tara:strand:+ start:8250 stop:8936 length:687 start_codon:yes stop_codon:yes gene_type:complete
MHKIELKWECFCRGEELDTHKDFLKNHGGIYAWIFNGKPPRVAYIGETGNYFNRFAKDHFQNILSGRWSTYKVPEEQDFIKFICQNVVGKKYEKIKDEKKYYRTYSLDAKEFNFKDHFFDMDYLSMHREFLFNLKFAFASMPDKDKAIRKDIEAILIIKIREQYARENNINQDDFILPGGRKWRDTPFGTISQHPIKSYLIDHSGDFCNELPEEIRAISDYKIELKDQ